MFFVYFKERNKLSAHVRHVLASKHQIEIAQYGTE